jgi:hypothetical protein
MLQRSVVDIWAHHVRKRFVYALGPLKCEGGPLPRTAFSTPETAMYGLKKILTRSISEATNTASPSMCGQGLSALISYLWGLLVTFT